MPPREIKTTKALGRCTYLPGCSQKRFTRDISFLAANDPQRELTDRQRA